MTSDIYEMAVNGRREFRQMYRDEREKTKALLALLRDVDEAINPPDRNGISLHEWNGRLKAITKRIRDVLPPIADGGER